MTSLIEYLKSVTDGKQESEVEEILCDGEMIKELTSEAQKILEKFQNINLLSFNFCQLKNLNHLPNIPKLSELQLSDNHIQGSELSKIKIYPQLKKLQLCNNKISKIEEIEVLKDLKELVELDLTENEVTKAEGYRAKVFEMFPKLISLDLVKKDGNPEVESSEEEDQNDEEDSFVVQDEEGEGFEDEEGEEEEDEEDEKPVKKQKLN